MSALAIIAVVIAAMVLGGWYFYGLIIAVFAIGLRELLQISETSFVTPKVVQWGLIVSLVVQVIVHIFVPTLTLYLVFVPIFAILIYGMFQRENFQVEQIAYMCLSYFYMLIPAVAAVTLSQYSMWFILLVAFIASGTDSGAYFVGVFFGKHKLAPHISPKKTIEGAIGGSLIGVLMAVVLFPYLLQQFAPEVWQTYLPLFSGGAVLVTSVIILLLSITTQFGDLVASNIKRQFGVKDFGNLFPGHGGVMDRVDGILVVLSLLALVVELSQFYI